MSAFARIVRPKRTGAAGEADFLERRRITYGEGWHNKHHAFPSSARQGLRRWEVDMTWWLVRGLEATGLVWKIKLPPSKEAATGSKT